MHQYVALLRGINVGGNNKIEMKQLVKLFQSLGFYNVRTYINSGNILFSAKKEVTARAFENAIEKMFGCSVPVLVIKASDIKRIAKNIPSDWTNGVDQKTDVLFLWDTYDSKRSLTLLDIREGVDNVMYSSGAIVWNIKRKDYRKSGMRKVIGTDLYKHLTGRNVNTVRKLAALLAAE